MRRKWTISTLEAWCDAFYKSTTTTTTTGTMEAAPEVAPALSEAF